MSEQGKERPIILGADEVCAILAGRKTQLRRVIKRQPLDILPCPNGRDWITLDTREPKPHGTLIRCRLGVPGERLWVRETWGAIQRDENGQFLQWRDVPAAYRNQSHNESLFYRATDNDPDYAGCWIPSVHMPRWASRLTLEITEVRVQRLQDISSDDAEAEGVDMEEALYMPCGADDAPIMLFSGDWECVNARYGHGWETNPWVWAVTFRRMEASQ